MRVFLSRNLLRVVDGQEDTIKVAGRLGAEITSGIDESLAELPAQVLRAYDLELAPGRSVDYVSKPVVQMPDEFDYFVDVESLDRLERETVIRMVPQGTRVWQAKHVPVRDLWVGGRGEVLDRKQREVLLQVTNELWKLPLDGRRFLFGEDIRGMRRRAFTGAILQAGGTVVRSPESNLDYFVTDTSDVVNGSSSARVLSTFVLSILLDRE